MKPTDAQGNALVNLLAPGNYVLWIPGRNGVAETPVTVSEGTESEVLLDLP